MYEPRILDRKSYKLSTTHSAKFWNPAGTNAICLVAARQNNVMSPTASHTINIELVIGSPLHNGAAGRGKPASASPPASAAKGVRKNTAMVGKMKRMNRSRGR